MHPTIASVTSCAGAQAAPATIAGEANVILAGEEGRSVSNGNWYRNEAWSDDVEKRFFEKLGRARSQRAQYLKIQAWYLLERHPDVCLRLVNYARENCPDEFWEQELCLYESKVLYQRGDVPAAIKKAQKAVEWRVKKRGIETDAPYWLAEIVLRSRSDALYSACLQGISELYQESPFPAQEFRHFACVALLHASLGESKAAMDSAKHAIEWARRDKNLLQNTRKQRLGLVNKKRGWPFDEVMRLAGGKLEV